MVMKWEGLIIYDTFLCLPGAILFAITSICLLDFLMDHCITYHGKER